MHLNLKDQTAIVIGGASGIGLAIAREFAAEQCGVAVVDLAPTCAATAAELGRELQTKTLGLVCDATHFPTMQEVAATVLREFGRCDHLVFAAGAGSGKFGFPFWNLQPSDWERIVRINLLGAVNAAHAFAPIFTAARRGTWLFLSSVAAQIGSQTDPPYSAAKAGLLNFAMCAAKDLADYNVRVNSICPGMIKTPLNRAVWQAWHDQQPAELRRSYEAWADEKVSKVAPLKRWQEPEDIAALAVFLASDRAKNITGQTLNVDGGQVMHW